MARFPDSRIVAARLSSQPPSPADSVEASASSDVVDVSLAAYSGGTVWASHPLRVAAGASVKLSTSGFDRTVRV